MREAKLQEDVIADLQAKKLPNYGTPNGAAQMAGRYGLGRALQKRGAHDGIPDILVFRAGADGKIGLAMELKIGKNKLSKAQEAWFKTLEQEGWRCGSRATRANPAVHA